MQFDTRWRTIYHAFQMLDNQLNTERLKRIAYVSEDGKTVYTHDEGYTTVTYAFVHRPRDYRYCVLETQGRALLVDMYDLKVSGGNPLKGEEITIPAYVLTFDTADAAIMYAVLATK